MNRIAITNGDGQWFDADKAELIKEDIYHDGRNWISKATNSQFRHQWLYRTKGGVWVLNTYSNWQGSQETYTIIDNDEAAAWLVKNGHEPHKACAAEFAALEIE